MNSFFPILTSKELETWNAQQVVAKKAHLPYVKKAQEEVKAFFKD